MTTMTAGEKLRQICELLDWNVRYYGGTLASVSQSSSDCVLSCFGYDIIGHAKTVLWERGKYSIDRDEAGVAEEEPWNLRGFYRLTYGEILTCCPTELDAIIAGLEKLKENEDVPPKPIGARLEELEKRVTKLEDR